MNRKLDHILSRRGICKRRARLHQKMIAILLVAAASATSNKFRTDEKQLHMLGTLKDLVKLERAEDTLVFGHFGRGESEAAARANFEAVARSFNPGFDKVRTFSAPCTWTLSLIYLSIRPSVRRRRAGHCVWAVDDAVPARRGAANAQRAGEAASERR